MSKKIENDDFINHFWEDGWICIKTVVDIIREPVLILDKDLRVVAANEPFYEIFKVTKKDTEKKVIYKLGDGQWNIPSLRKLLENILPKHTYFKGYEVDHEFPGIGRKVMILNARQIYCKGDTSLKPFPSIILLAIEDVTDMMLVADMITSHITNFKN